MSEWECVSSTPQCCRKKNPCLWCILDIFEHHSFYLKVYKGCWRTMTMHIHEKFKRLPAIPKHGTARHIGTTQNFIWSIQTSPLPNITSPPHELSLTQITPNWVWATFGWINANLAPLGLCLMFRIGTVCPMNRLFPFFEIEVGH